MSEGISVKDRLPDKDGYYLCHLFGEGIDSYRVVEWRNGWTDQLFSMRNYLKSWRAISPEVKDNE
jgi:hypothetical protein